jgi:hypothetical protein
MKILTNLKVSKGFYNSKNKLSGVILTLTCTDPVEALNTKDFTFSWVPENFEIDATTISEVLTRENLHHHAILAGDYFRFFDICIRECELLWGGDTAVAVDVAMDNE